MTPSPTQNPHTTLIALRIVTTHGPRQGFGADERP